MQSGKNNTCDRCGKTEDGIDWFGRVYRIVEMRKGRLDPGNLCGSCAGSDTGKRIAGELRDKMQVGRVEDAVGEVPK